MVLLLQSLTNVRMSMVCTTCSDTLPNPLSCFPIRTPVIVSLMLFNVVSPTLCKVVPTTHIKVVLYNPQPCRIRSSFPTNNLILTLLSKGNHYFPPSEVHMKYFKDSAHTSVCGYKGTANYYSIDVDGKVNQDGMYCCPSS